MPSPKRITLFEKQESTIANNTNHNKSPPLQRRFGNTPLLGHFLDEFKKERQNKDKFSQAYQESSNLLIRVKTVFPFDFFPDVLTVDTLKVNFVHNIFFFSSFVESIPIADITNVVIEQSVFFATLRISFISFPTRQIYIKPLWKSDAQKAREIIAGLMITSREKIEMEKVRVKDPEVIARLGQFS